MIHSMHLESLLAFVFGLFTGVSMGSALLVFVLPSLVEKHPQ